MNHNPNQNSNPNPSNNEDDGNGNDNGIPNIKIVDHYDTAQIPRIAPEEPEGPEEDETYSTEEHTETPAQQDWVLATVANQPRPFNKEIIGLRGDQMYIGRIGKIDNNKLYMIINGSANTAPRVIDFWTDIPDHLKINRKIGATQGIVTWLKSPNEMLSLRELWHLVQMRTSSKIDLSRTRILQIDEINGQPDKVRLIINRSVEPLIIDRNDKVIAVSSIRTLRRRELNVLALRLGSDFHEDTKLINI